MGHPQTGLTRNAAQGQDVKNARRLERRREERNRQYLYAVMNTAAGRAFVWSWIGRLGVFGSIWEANARIHYNAGRQDAGHELMAAVIDVAPDLWQLMETEARQQAKRDEAEVVATQTARAGEPTDRQE